MTSHRWLSINGVGFIVSNNFTPLPPSLRFLVPGHLTNVSYLVYSATDASNGTSAGPISCSDSKLLVSAYTYKGFAGAWEDNALYGETGKLARSCVKISSVRTYSLHQRGQHHRRKPGPRNSRQWRWCLFDQSEIAPRGFEGHIHHYIVDFL